MGDQLHHTAINRNHETSADNEPVLVHLKHESQVRFMFHVKQNTFAR